MTPAFKTRLKSSALWPLLRWGNRTRIGFLLMTMVIRKGVKIERHPDFIEFKKGNKSIRLHASNKVYTKDMVEFFDCFFDSVEPEIINGRQVVDFRGPRFHHLLGFDAFPLSFPSTSEPFQTTQQYLDFAQLQEGDVVLDLGAYAAVTSIVFGQQVGKSGRVLAVEPDAKSRACAATNLQKAAEVLGVTNIKLLDYAIWDHCDGIAFSHEGSMGASACSIVGPERGDNTIVPSITIEKLCEQEQLSRVDFIKIDIEGAEIEVLKSSLGVIARFRPRLLIESHCILGGSSLERCLNLLSQLPYNVRVVEQDGIPLPLIEAVPLPV